jgi:hypothetical protein
MTDEVVLDDTALRFIGQRIAQMKTLEAELNGALSLLIEQHDLQGRWQLDLPNRRLVRSSESQLKAA